VFSGFGVKGFTVRGLGLVVQGIDDFRFANWNVTTLDAGFPVSPGVRGD
jgi:hypothetical protein